MKYPQWEQIDQIAEYLAREISKTYKPDIVVGILNGGAIPATLLANYLNVESLAMMRITFYVGKVRTQRPVIVQYLPMGLVEGQQILLVDDIADTGKTLALAMDYLSSVRVKRVKIATFFYKKTSKVQPDWYVEETESWVVFPWEVHGRR